MTSISVFIIDDHYMVIEGIRSLLLNEPGIEWQGHATTAASALAYLKQNTPPDIILMDINLPDKSGIDLCREVKLAYSASFIIGLSTFNQQSFVQKMLDNGASGYILKNADKEEIVDAIHLVIKGKTYLSHEAAQSLKGSPNNQIILTRREKEILELIAEGLTNNEIAQQLFISISTVDTHRKNLLTKFDTKNTASLVKKAIQLQLISL